MRNPAVFRRALAGVDSVYHICPNVHPDEVEIGETLIAAALEEEVERLVYHSVLLPAEPDMPHHWLKHRVEQRLASSGIVHTVLQPCAYMQNVLGQWNPIVADGVIHVPYGADVAMSLVDLEDVAAAAAEVLAAPGQPGAVHELCGPEALTTADLARHLGTALGRAVRVQTIGLEAWDYRVDALLKMFRYYDRHGFVGDSLDLRGLLGRDPGTFEAFAGRAVHARRPGS